MKILFVCTGNTCRSPMAEALIKHKLPHAKVQSAGIHAGLNQPANQHAINVLQENNIPLTHRSQPVSDQLLNWADLILTMTTQHKQSLILQYPHFQEKYFTLKEYVSEADKKVWNELKQAYADYEEKRSLFIQENQYKVDNNHLDELLANHLQDEITRIQQLEVNLINYDISDPFGGDLDIYKKTKDELDKYISLLIKKVKE